MSKKNNLLFLTNISDLNECQHASFYHFLYKTLKEELSKIHNPLKYLKHNKLAEEDIISLISEDIKFVGKEIHFSYKNKKKATEDVMSMDVYLSYECRTIKSSNIISIKKNYIFLGEIPLMTPQGTFFVNGLERVVINQLVRVPGIKFLKNLDNKNKVNFYAILTSVNGIPLKINFDKEFFNTNKYYKIGDKNKSNTNITIKKQPFDLINYLKDINADRDITVYDSLVDTNKLNLFNDILDNKKKLKILTSSIRPSFRLGKIGRLNVNDRLELRLPETIDNLTIQDLIQILKIANELYKGTHNFDFIDHLKHKKFNSVGNMLLNNLKLYNNIIESLPTENYSNIDKNNEKKSITELTDIQLEFKNKFKKIDKNNFISNNDDIIFNDYNEKSQEKQTKTVEEKIYEYLNSYSPNKLINTFIFTFEENLKFLNVSPLSQFFDNSNPLAEITHKRRVTLKGPGGIVAGERMKGNIRDVQPSQESRLCPLETLEGKNAGLVSSLSLFAKINLFGQICAPYYLINDYSLSKEKSPFFLDFLKESKIFINFSKQFLSFFKQKGLIKKRLFKNSNEFNFKNNKISHFLNISPFQFFSIATSLQPFMEHNDATRSQMAASMQRQSVPLLFSQPPIVGTGIEAIAACSSNFNLKSSSEGLVINSSALYIQVYDIFSQTINYILKKNKRSNQKTCLNQRPIVWSGEKIFSGQMLADGSSFSGGEMALGQNLNVAYIPWEGYNYEDAIVISERLIQNKLFTSLHIVEIETLIYTQNSWLGGKALKSTFESFSNIFKNLDNYGIIKIGSHVASRDILTIQFTKPHRRKLLMIKKMKNKLGHKKNEIDLFTKQNVKFFLCPYYLTGRVTAINLVENLKEVKVKENIKNLENIENIENIKNNPEYYKPIKTIFGKVYLGNLVLKKLYEKHVHNSSNAEYNKLIKYLNSHFEVYKEYSIKIYITQVKNIRIGDKLSARHGNKGVISLIESVLNMPSLQDGTKMDILFNPLGIPSRMNLGQIFESILGLAGRKLGKRFKIVNFDELHGENASKLLINQKLKEISSKVGQNFLYNFCSLGKTPLRDGRSGSFFDNVILNGNIYIVKLIHLISEKFTARSISKYNQLLQQPVQGKANKGGQRFGEMEVWALEAHGCILTLQDFLSSKADGYFNRFRMNEYLNKSIINNVVPTLNIPEMFHLFLHELNLIGLHLEFHQLNLMFDKTSELKHKLDNPIRKTEKLLNLSDFINSKTFKHRKI